MLLFRHGGPCKYSYNLSKIRTDVDSVLDRLTLNYTQCSEKK